jgi:PAS domain S-box-containing protein
VTTHDVAMQGEMQRKPGLTFFLAALCVALAIPILAFAGFVGVEFVTAERARLEARAQETARTIGMVIDHDLSGMKAVVETLATSESLEREDYDAFDRRARRMTSRIGSNIVVRDLTGQQVVNTRVPRGTALPQVSQPDTDTVVIQTLRPVITGVFTGAISGTEVIIIVAPVISGEEVVALINLSVPTERFLSIIQSERPDAATTVYVADRDQRLIAHTDDDAGVVGQPYAYRHDAWADALRGSYTDEDRSGDAVFVAFQRSAMSGWVVGVEVPRSVLDAPLSQSLKLLFGLGVLLALVSLVATFLIWRVLRRAVTSVENAATQLAEGKLVSAPSTPIAEADAVGRAISSASYVINQRTERLRASQARLRRIMDNLMSYVALMDTSGRLVEINNAPLKATGVARDELVGKPLSDVCWWSNSPEVQAQLSEALKRAVDGEVARHEAELQKLDGERLTIEFQITPLRDEQGAITDFIFSGVDITDRKRGEAQNAHLAAIVSSTSDAVISFDLDERRIRSWNRGAEVMFGYSTDEAIGQTVTLLLPEKAHLPIENERGLFDLIVSEGHVHVDTVRQRKDGSLVEVAATGTLIVDPHGNVIGVSAVFRDITQRKQAEAQQKLLIRELHHRIKNTLATVQAIAGATVRSSKSLSEFQDVFAARLSALAHTHSLLTENAWAGGSLRELLEAQLGSLAVEPDRASLGGPHLQLPSEALLAFGMIAHELATNSIKHGALSVMTGRIAITWAINRVGGIETLTFTWQESGGPAVSQPSRSGFGTRLIDRVVKMQLNGKVKVEYQETGIVVVIEAPLPDPDRAKEVSC